MIWKSNHVGRVFVLVWCICLSGISHGFAVSSDADSDGVPDHQDYCPKTPSGMTVWTIADFDAGKAPLHWVGCGGPNDPYDPAYVPPKEPNVSINDSLPLHMLEKGTVLRLKNEVTLPVGALFFQLGSTRMPNAVSFKESASEIGYSSRLDGQTLTKGSAFIFDYTTRLPAQFQMVGRNICIQREERWDCWGRKFGYLCPCEEWTYGTKIERVFAPLTCFKATSVQFNVPVSICVGGDTSWPDFDADPSLVQSYYPTVSNILSVFEISN